MYEINPQVVKFKHDKMFKPELIKEQYYALKQKEMEIMRNIMQSKNHISKDKLVSLLNKLNFNNINDTVTHILNLLNEDEYNIKILVKTILQTASLQPLFHDNFIKLVSSLFHKINMKLYFIKCIKHFYIYLELLYLNNNLAEESAYITFCNINKMKKNSINAYIFLCKLYIFDKELNNRLHIFIRNIFKNYILYNITKDQLICEIFISCVKYIKITNIFDDFESTISQINNMLKSKKKWNRYRLLLLNELDSTVNI